MARKPRTRAGIDDVTLMPVSPSQQRRRRRLWAAGALVLALLLFAGGYILGASGALDASATNARLRAELRDTRSELEEARNELALNRTDTELGEQARERVRQQIKDMRDQVAELEEAVAFYKNVMAPDSDDQGLQIARLEVQPEKENNSYRYRLMLVQAGDNRSYVSGDVSLKLRGTRDGKAVSYRQDQWLADGSDTHFRFRYFQELNGRFRVPDGMEVEAIEVEAESGGRRPYQVQRTINWQ